NEEKKIPIHKVRLVRKEKTIRPIRDGKAYVKPGNTHHVCLFEITTPDSRKRKDAIFVTVLDAVERVKHGEEIIQREHPEYPNDKFLFSLSANEMVLLKHDGKEDLYRFEKAASTTGQMWFRHHTAAGKSSDKIGQVSKRPSTLECRKVTVDP